MQWLLEMAGPFFARLSECPRFKPSLFRSALIFGLAVLLSGCSPEGSSTTHDASSSEVSTDTQDDATVSGETGHDESTEDDGSSASTDGMTFHGYRCTDDCSGHRAGYEWAEEHSIASPDECGGNSDSFIEGCKAYAGEDGPDGDDADSEDPQ